ncbi:amidohydrolase family protein [Photobacterium halotolerans]|uniref:Amidohydrolase-related domain-containing protein n=1 Tax=Photobacterium halotolerans TaxID=265726 RepID=A0A0F5VBJ3_9GAMM|nr:amidohydrolase family protein [Photobacterium halotolerans]KKC99498.1 hypothetical protein KY46_12685 [Photobacterium halotolerans]
MPTQKIIDLHTHLFNAGYVPLREIMNVSWGIPKAESYLIAKLIRVFIKYSDLDYEQAFKNARAEKSLTHGDELIYDEYSRVIENLALQVYEHPNANLHAEELSQLLDQIEFEYGEESEFHETRKELASFGSWVGKAIKKLLEKAFSAIESGLDKLDFVFKMLCSETYLLTQLQKFYHRKFGDSFLLMHLMMDMQYPYHAKKGSIPVNFDEEQLPKMAALSQRSAGSLIGFSAFDPLRCLTLKLDKREITERIEASRDYGMCGFKFYPPLGYKPSGNDDPKLEAVVDVFFSYCENNGIPVFTHCTPTGFEVHPGKSGEHAHPKYWKVRLEKNPNLIVCFGHAGGGKRMFQGNQEMGWLAGGGLDSEEWASENNFARWVAELCRTYPNAYCEFGYSHEVMNSASDEQLFIKRLTMELNRNDGFYSLSEKIMYGSDWHMPEVVNDLNKYIESMVRIFDSPDYDLAGVKELFFYENAIKYLNLDKYLDWVGSRLGTIYVQQLRNRIGI